jgi:hypothetical protein
MRRVTPKQKAFLEYMGIPVPPSLSLEQASQIIDEAKWDDRFSVRFETWNYEKGRLHPNLYPELAGFSLTPIPKHSGSSLLGIAIAIGALVLICCVVAVLSGDGAPATKPVGSPNPRAATLKHDPTTVLESQRRAVASYPRLGLAGSPENARFVALVASARRQRPALFENNDWPMILAREAFGD